MSTRTKAINRRNFLKYSALTGLVTATASACNPKNKLENNSHEILFNLGDTILFQGDSITDGGRNRAELDPNKGALGYNYVQLIGAHLLNKYADKQLNLVNKGVSGDKVYQILNRWNEDCVQIKPHFLSILVGVNDFWHTLDFGYEGTVETYATDLRKLLDGAKSLNTQLIIGEPFILKTGAVNDKWYPAFAGYQQAAEQIAKQYNAIFIPYQRIFDEALTKAPANYWIPDGVHPSLAGAQLMADAWIKTVGQNIQTH